MALRKHMKRFVEGLFVDADTNTPVVLNTRRYDSKNRPLCTGHNNTCTNTAHNKGKNHGGFTLLCRHCSGHTGEDSYKLHKKKVPYCENIDGRLGYECTTTIQDPCMLGTDHINEVHDDDRIDNWQVLCACCHSYKSNVFGKRIKSGDLLVEDMLKHYDINKATLQRKKANERKNRLK